MSYQQPVVQNNVVQPLHTLKIIPKSSSFFTDDFIEGQVELTTPVQIIINDINLVLSTMEYWSTYSKEMNTNIMEKNNQNLFSVNLDVRNKLNINTNLVALKEGKFEFGFKFKIPVKVGPSFEFPSKEGIAHFRYVLTANIISPYVKGSCCIYIILKTKQQIVMNKQITFVAENTIHKYLLFDGGKTKMTVTSLNGTDNFKFGETINFNINVDNTKGKVHAIKCKIGLKRKVIFKTKTSQVRATFIDNLITKEVKTDTSAGENKGFDISINLEEIDNKKLAISKAGIPYDNISNINFFLTSIKSLLIECSYSIKFTLYFDTHVKHDDRPRIIMNIILCHQSFDEYKNEMNQNFNMKQPNNIMNPNIPPPNNNEYPNMLPTNNMMPNTNNSVIPPTLSKRARTLQLRNEPPVDQFNQINDKMNNNNIGEDLPSIEEIEENKFDKPNFDNNYINNYENNNFGNNYDINQFDNNNNNINNYENNNFGNNYDNNNNININNYENNNYGNQINNFDNTNYSEIGKEENNGDNNPPPLPYFSGNNDYPENPNNY